MENRGGVGLLMKQKWFRRKGEIMIIIRILFLMTGALNEFERKTQEHTEGGI